MNKDIKEILDRLYVYKNENDEMKYQPEDILVIEDIWLLLDYITNLQEERDFYKCTDSMNMESNIELRSRIAEAIEYINKYCIDDEFYINLSNKEKAIIQVKNILQGKDILKGSDKDGL